MAIRCSLGTEGKEWRKKSRNGGGGGGHSGQRRSLTNWNSPAGFTCTPDTPALELDGLEADVGGQRCVVVDPLLLRRV